MGRTVSSSVYTLRRATFEVYHKFVDVGLPSMTSQHAHTRERDMGNNSEARDAYLYVERHLDRLRPAQVSNVDPMGLSSSKATKPHQGS